MQPRPALPARARVTMALGAMLASTAGLCLAGIAIRLLRLAAEPWPSIALLMAIFAQTLFWAGRIGAATRPPAPLARPVVPAGARTASPGAAGRDSLTGLANSATYETWLRAAWLRGTEAATPVSLVLADLDHFRLYNEYYGDAAGDACLQTVARCLREQSRGQTDNVARISGQLFAVLLPGLTLTQAGDIAERLRAAIAAADLPHLGVGSTHLTISCGAACLVPDARLTGADLFASAEAAVLAAKRAGRNRVCLADQIVAARATVAATK